MRQLMRMVAMMMRENRGWTSTWMATRRTGEKGDRNHIESSAENLKMSFPLLITMKVWNIRIFSLYPMKSFSSPFYFGSRGRCLREGWRWGRWGTRRPAWCRHVSHVWQCDCIDCTWWGAACPPPAGGPPPARPPPRRHHSAPKHNSLVAVGSGADNEILRNLPNIRIRPEISLAALVVSSHAGHRKAGTCLVEVLLCVS